MLFIYFNFEELSSALSTEIGRVEQIEKKQTMTKCSLFKNKSSLVMNIVFLNQFCYFAIFDTLLTTNFIDGKLNNTHQTLQNFTTNVPCAEFPLHYRWKHWVEVDLNYTKRILPI